MRMPEPPQDDPISKQPFCDKVLEQAQGDGYEGEDIDEAADWLEDWEEDRACHSHRDAQAERESRDATD